MRNTNIVRDAVKVVLTQNEAARNSDWVCINETLKFYVDTNLSLDEICNLGLSGKIPTFETIRRCRQKLQETHPELQGDERVRKFRAEKEEEMKELMKGEC